MTDNDPHGEASYWRHHNDKTEYIRLSTFEWILANGAGVVDDTETPHFIGDNGDRYKWNEKAQQFDRLPAAPYIDVTFTGPPKPDYNSQFVDVHNPQGESITVGNWIEHDDGTWSLRITGDDIPDQT